MSSSCRGISFGKKWFCGPEESWRIPNRTALMAAVFGAHVECVRLLCEHGADVNVRIGKWRLISWMAGQIKCSPDVQERWRECAQILAQHGGDLFDRGFRSPLLIAVFAGANFPLVKSLVHMGANVNLCEPQIVTHEQGAGFQLYDRVNFESLLDVIKLLLKSGQSMESYREFYTSLADCIVCHRPERGGLKWIRCLEMAGLILAAGGCTPWGIDKRVKHFLAGEPAAPLWMKRAWDSDTLIWYDFSGDLKARLTPDGSTLKHLCREAIRKRLIGNPQPKRFHEWHDANGHCTRSQAIFCYNDPDCERLESGKCSKCAYLTVAELMHRGPELEPNLFVKVPLLRVPAPLDRTQTLPLPFLLQKYLLYNQWIGDEFKVEVETATHVGGKETGGAQVKRPTHNQNKARAKKPQKDEAKEPGKSAGAKQTKNAGAKKAEAKEPDKAQGLNKALGKKTKKTEAKKQTKRKGQAEKETTKAETKRVNLSGGSHEEKNKSKKRKRTETKTETTQIEAKKQKKRTEANKEIKSTDSKVEPKKADDGKTTKKPHSKKAKETPRRTNNIAEASEEPEVKQTGSEARAARKRKSNGGATAASSAAPRPRKLKKR